MSTVTTRTKSSSQRQPMDVYKEVTRRIVLRLSEGDIPWRKPWNAPFKEDIINYKTRKPYNGINRFILSQPGEYLTFNQCREKGGNIVKGAKGNLIVKYGFFVPKEHKAKAEQLKKEGKDISHLEIPYLRHDWVFHISQTEGIPTLCCQTEPTSSAQNPTDIADYVISDFCSRKETKLNIEQVDFCMYDPATDTVTLPQKSQFRTEEEWYNSVFIELIRSEVIKARKSDDTSRVNLVKEELIVEIGASMVLNAVGLTRQEAADNTQSKVQEWIKEMNRDTRLIVSASSQAEKLAKDFVSSVFSEEEEDF